MSIFYSFWIFYEHNILIIEFFSYKIYNDDMNTLGDRLKSLRKERHLTQSELAEELHLTRHQISNYETNQVEPGLEAIINYCKFFNTRADFLLGLDEDYDNANLEQHTIQQIVRSANRLSSEKKNRYLNQVRLYAIFLERHKETL
ncbi:helix-turn-helix domain-containing protein [Streptomyces sp. NPDC057131]|uniref:helix-turn-helix domain-containing protein n=1 Tax=Streptomyces sp. NPDC057131 TaxID=3346027 RepID=UPI0036D3B7BC